MIIKVGNVDQYMCGQGESMIEPRQNAAHVRTHVKSIPWPKWPTPKLFPHQNQCDRAWACGNCSSAHARPLWQANAHATVQIVPTRDTLCKRTRLQLCPRATPCASARGCNCAHATSSARAIVLKPILNWKQDDTTCRNVTRSYFVWIRSINAKFCVHSSRFLITKKWNICLNF